MDDICIIGAGTAGLTAAIYCLRAGKSVTVIEEKTFGGQIINAAHIENFPGISNISGAEFAFSLYNQAINFGMKYVNDRVTNIKKEKDYFSIKCNQSEYKAYKVIIATGLKKRELGIESEKNHIGKGLSYCATCDGAFYKNKEVAIVGGGNTALSEAKYLSEICSFVNIIHRNDNFRADSSIINELSNKTNVKFLTNKVIENIIGDTVEKIELKDTIDGSLSEINVKGIFVAIGHIPSNDFCTDLVDIDEDGYIIADESCITKTAGVYVAGDCRRKLFRQLTTAAGDGTIAALAACK